MQYDQVVNDLVLNNIVTSMSLYDHKFMMHIHFAPPLTCLIITQTVESDNTKVVLVCPIHTVCWLYLMYYFARYYVVSCNPSPNINWSTSSRREITYQATTSYLIQMYSTPESSDTLILLSTSMYRENWPASRLSWVPRHSTYIVCKHYVPNKTTSRLTIHNHDCYEYVYCSVIYSEGMRYRSQQFNSFSS